MSLGLFIRSGIINLQELTVIATVLVGKRVDSERVVSDGIERDFSLWLQTMLLKSGLSCFCFLALAFPKVLFCRRFQEAEMAFPFLWRVSR